MTTTVAFLSVAALLGLFLAHRLYLHVTEALAAPEQGSTALEQIHKGVKGWWDETRSRVGLGPYKYRVSAFEDYKAFDSPKGSPLAASASVAPELKPPRIVYEEITDYSKHHPQPTPSFPGPRTVKIEREREHELQGAEDLFAPPHQPDTTVVKREIDEGEWTSESESGRKTYRAEGCAT